MGQPTPAMGPDQRQVYRMALLNGSAGVPTHEIMRIFEEDRTDPEFEAAAFSELEDLLAHIDRSARAGAPVDVVFIGPGPKRPFGAARSVREQDGQAQIIFLARAPELLRIRRAVLFNPLLSDMWSAEVDGGAEPLRNLIRDAAEATRRRRHLRNALQGINRQLQSADAVPDARERLATSDRYLASLLRLAPDVVVSTDLDGRIVSWNEAAARTFGYSFDESIGMPLSALFSGRPVHNARPVIEAIRAGGAIREQQIICRRADGSAFEGEVAVAPIYDELDRRIGISMIARDISEQVQEKRKLQEATERLAMLVEELTARTAEAEAASRAKSGFLAAVSHELRTPLQAVIGYAALMEEQIAGPISEEQRIQLGRIRDSADHLLALIEQLLDLSRSETGHFAVDNRTFDLCALTREAVAVVRADPTSAGLEIPEPDCLDDRLRSFMGDPVRVRQIIFNLLSNAVKFTEKGGVVTEVAWEDAGAEPEVRIRVRDSGIGLTQEEIERIFDPFFQARQEFSGRAPGLGLGLSISLRLAEAMDGRIEVRSDSGQGSEFSLVLPVRRG